MATLDRILREADRLQTQHARERLREPSRLIRTHVLRAYVAAVRDGQLSPTEAVAWARCEMLRAVDRLDTGRVITHQWKDNLASDLKQLARTLEEERKVAQVIPNR